MQISRVAQEQIQRYNQEQIRIQEKRDEDYRKVLERKTFENIVAERVERNIRLDLDKGRTIDVEC